jgi:hypothetical protein
MIGSSRLAPRPARRSCGDRIRSRIFSREREALSRRTASKTMVKEREVVSPKPEAWPREMRRSHSPKRGKKPAKMYELMRKPMK